jgi:hypothetical protein
MILGLATWPLRELIELYFAESRDNLITRCVLNTLELAAAYAAGRWLFGWLQRRAWLPQVWLDYLLIGPLRLIESAVYLIWRRAV